MTRAAPRRPAAGRAALLLAIAMTAPAIAAPPGTATPADLPYTGRNDELFGLMPTAARRTPAAGPYTDQQACENLARLAGIAADIGNRAGQQDALRQMRDAGCPQ